MADEKDDAKAEERDRSKFGWAKGDVEIRRPPPRPVRPVKP